MPYEHGKSIIKIAVADDHDMFRELVSTYIDTIENCKVVIQASNGKELIEKLGQKPNTSLILLDISMPVMDGYNAAAIIIDKFPDIKIIFCSIYNSDIAIYRMIEAGGHGFIHKGASASELKKAFYDIMKHGHSYPNINGKFIRNHQNSSIKKRNGKIYLSPTELKFLKLICTEKTYKQIADDLNLSMRQVDYLRENLFQRFDVHNRTGLAFNAYNNGILYNDNV